MATTTAPATATGKDKPIITEDPEVRKKLFWGIGILAFFAGVLYHVTNKSKSYVKGHGDGFARGFRAAGGAGNPALPSYEREMPQLAQASESHQDE